MEITKKMGEYEEYLRWHGFAERTIESYVWVAAYFERNYQSVDARTLRQYRDWLVGTFKPSTANQRMQAINCYLVSWAKTSSSSMRSAFSIARSWTTRSTMRGCNSSRATCARAATSGTAMPCASW